MYKCIGGPFLQELEAEGREVEVPEITTCCEVCGSGDREDSLLLCDGCDLG